MEDGSDGDDEEGAENEESIKPDDGQEKQERDGAGGAEQEQGADALDLTLHEQESDRSSPQSASVEDVAAAHSQGAPDTQEAPLVLETSFHSV